MSYYPSFQSIYDNLPKNADYFSAPGTLKVNRVPETELANSRNFFRRRHIVYNNTADQNRKKSTTWDEMVQAYRRPVVQLNELKMPPKPHVNTFGEQAERDREFDIITQKFRDPNLEKEVTELEETVKIVNANKARDREHSRNHYICIDPASGYDRRDEVNLRVLENECSENNYDTFSGKRHNDTTNYNSYYENKTSDLDLPSNSTMVLLKTLEKNNLDDQSSGFNSQQVDTNYGLEMTRGIVHPKNDIEIEKLKQIAKNKILNTTGIVKSTTMDMLEDSSKFSKDILNMEKTGEKKLEEIQSYIVPHTYEHTMRAKNGFRRKRIITAGIDGSKESVMDRAEELLRKKNENFEQTTTGLGQEYVYKRDFLEPPYLQPRNPEYDRDTFIDVNNNKTRKVNIDRNSSEQVNSAMKQFVDTSEPIELRTTLPKSLLETEGIHNTFDRFQTSNNQPVLDASKYLNAPSMSTTTFKGSTNIINTMHQMDNKNSDTTQFYGKYANKIDRTDVEVDGGNVSVSGRYNRSEREINKDVIERTDTYRSKSTGNRAISRDNYRSERNYENNNTNGNSAFRSKSLKSDNNCNLSTTEKILKAYNSKNAFERSLFLNKNNNLMNYNYGELKGEKYIDKIENWELDSTVGSVDEYLKKNMTMSKKMAQTYEPYAHSTNKILPPISNKWGTLLSKTEKTIVEKKETGAWLYW